jgi:hypothetical protein
VLTVLNINDLLLNRQGVMLIGQAMEGKTTALKILMDTHNRLHREELERKQKDYIVRKALAGDANPDKL